MFESAGSGAGWRLAALERLTADLLADTRSASSWGSPDRVAVLSGLDRLAGVLAAARAHLLVAEREDGAARAPGDRSFEAARARAARIGIGEATRQVRQADALVAMPEVAAAVQSGAVPLEHLDAIARTASRASVEVARHLTSPAGQQSVVAMARAHDGPAFARSLAQWVATMDPAGLEADHQTQRRERFLVLTDRPDGTFLRGRLDRVAGHVLRLAVESAGEVPGEDRSAEQAAADALVAVAQQVLAGTPGRAVPVQDAQSLAQQRADEGSGVTAGAVVGTAGAEVEPVPAADRPVGGAVNRPHVSLLLPIETLAALRAAQRQRPTPHPDRFDDPDRLAAGGHGDPDRLAAGGHGDTADDGTDTADEGTRNAEAGSGTAEAGTGAAKGGTGAPEGGTGAAAGGAGTWAPVPPAILEDGTPIPGSEVARILCDCDVTRIAVSAEGVPLDLGRTRRVYTAAHRRAVIARDRHCAWNGCAKPARWDEIHHIRWWDRDNGPTSIGNAVLLCVYHHHEVHRHDLTIQRHTPPPATRARPGTSTHAHDTTTAAASHPPTATAGTARPAGATGVVSAAGAVGVVVVARTGGAATPARYTFRNRAGHVINAPPVD